MVKRWQILHTAIGAAEGLDETFNIRRTKAIDRVNEIAESQFVAENPGELADRIVQESSYDLISLDLDGLSATTGTAHVFSSDHPPGYDFQEPTSVERNVVYYTLPTYGPIELLRYRASSYQRSGHPSVQLNKTAIYFDYVSFDNDPKKANEARHKMVSRIQPLVDYLNEDLRRFNDELPALVSDAISARRKRIADRGALFDGLDVPIKFRPGSQEHILKPIIQPRERIKSIVKRSPTATVTHAELGSKNYDRLIEALSSLGRGFERLPSSYRDREEEDIRDSILLFLDLIFEPTAGITGEAFNKKGKTDILVKSHGFNVFAAECKFWDGQQKFMETIDQLLGYLTHRDNQVAVVMFDQNQKFSNDLNTALATVKAHPNYLSTLDETDKRQTKHIFFLGEDKGLKVVVSVLMFHFPKIVAGG